MQFIRRFWAAGLILIMVAIHAAIIGYVRSRVARLNHLKSSAVEVGEFRFQPIMDKTNVYHFRLHAVVDPTKHFEGRERLTQMQMEIVEESERMLRTADADWLHDPKQAELRERLMEVVVKHLPENLIQRVLITDWLEVPVTAIKL
ncbi:MAG: hypothetical protein AAF989_06360 [Planctomycetota bacterium]